ncbi:zinc finger protein 438 [Bufo bufo]|uniref:zinc finger protein 438 n=1 Tax=Bufo bufo TaxID=8384 RepID=UPI001ABE7076|nr:zinc finger protein 438 [Bufo bufo]
MHHVQEISAGKAASPPDESKISIGSSGIMHCKKTVPSTTHFRTIAPKVAPKVLSSYSSCSYPSSLSDVMPGAKPLIINTQNYTLMKVAGHDGTFSLVALPQVTSPVGGSVIQTTGIPLQENLKLPIPRYQPACSKKLLNKRSKGPCKPKTENSSEQVNQDGPSEGTATLHRKPEKAKPLVVEESGFQSQLFPGSGAEVCDVNNCTITCMEKSLKFPTFCTGSPVKFSAHTEKTIGSSDCGSLVRYESTKVVDPTNSLTVFSPVVFGSPLPLLQSVPKGKLPILPYSKIKKSIALENNVTKPNVGQTGLQTDTCQVHVTSPSVSVLNVSTVNSPCQPLLTSDSGVLSKQSSGLGRKRGKKRKSFGEMLGYQTKMRLVGDKLIMCKEKCKAQVGIIGKSETSLKKYRNIMPKPMVEIQSLASLDASNPLFQANMAECHLRNRLVGSRLHRWRQGEQMQKSAARVLHRCHVCDYGFQFKHHLQDHLNSHSNKRPYHCRLCRKAYVHSGSLSTHMKLHHSESRLKKLMCCEFCAKVFGHIRVYFGHLKEVHRVIISTESYCKQPERKTLILKAKPEDHLLLNRNKNIANEEDSIPGPTDEIKLQIKCGRCHFIAPTFSDMKLHLLSVHGDESQEVLPEGVLESRQGVQEEVVKQATHHWKLLSERRNGPRGNSCDEVLAAASRMKEPLRTSDSTAAELSASESTPSVEGKDNSSQSMKLSSEIKFYCRNHFNCLLCTQMLETQRELFEHWETKHNCENPLVLWMVFNALPKSDQEIT